jgi:peptide/nickel transport system ATP-binding protein
MPSSNVESQPFVLCHDIFKIYRRGNLEVVALRGLDLEVNRGEVLGIVGPSGSGKTTLLNILAGLEAPSAGKVIVGGLNIVELSPSELTHYRRNTAGFVWQSAGYNLFSHLTALQNVEVPQMLAGQDPWSRKQRAEELLQAVGLLDKKDQLPATLSGGEQQRVAIAVALANSPSLLLADEPTGDLDSSTASQVFRLLHELSRTFGTTVVIVTHYPRIADYVDRVVSIRDGRTNIETVLMPTFTPTDVGPPSYLEEYVIVDQAGRLQIPQEYLEKLPLGQRVKVQADDSKIVLVPEGEAALTKPDQRGAKEVSSPGWRRQIEATIVPSAEPILQAHSLQRVFQHGANDVWALRGVTLDLFPGQAVALMGRSGSGKTTLLHVLGGLDHPTEGHVLLQGQDIHAISEKERALLRRKTFGFVFQSFALLPTFSAEENVELPLLIAGMNAEERRHRVKECLSLVGLSRRARHRPFEMSGGEQQRLAIARAIANKPKILLADEPTGELDTTNAWVVFALLKELASSLDIAVLVATHDQLVEKAGFKVWKLQDGALVSDVAEVLDT